MAQIGSYTLEELDFALHRERKEGLLLYPLAIVMCLDPDVIVNELRKLKDANPGKKLHNVIIDSLDRTSFTQCIQGENIVPKIMCSWATAATHNPAVRERAKPGGEIGMLEANQIMAEVIKGHCSLLDFPTDKRLNRQRAMVFDTVGHPAFREDILALDEILSKSRDTQGKPQA